MRVQHSVCVCVCVWWGWGALRNSPAKAYQSLLVCPTQSTLSAGCNSTAFPRGLCIPSTVRVEGSRLVLFLDSENCFQDRVPGVVLELGALADSAALGVVLE